MQADELASEILSLWNFGDPAESERRFRALLERVDADSEAGAVAACTAMPSRNSTGPSVGSSTPSASKTWMIRRS